MSVLKFPWMKFSKSQMSCVEIFHTAVTITLICHSVAAKTMTKTLTKTLTKISVAAQVEDTNIALEVQIPQPIFSNFYNCLCEKTLKKFHCYASFQNVHLEVYFMRKEFSYSIKGKRCGFWNNRKTGVTLNYASQHSRCSVSNDGTVIYVGSVLNECSSTCLAIVTNIIPSQRLVNVGSVSDNSESCNTSCCNKVFQKLNDKIRPTDPTDHLITPSTLVVTSSTATDNVTTQLPEPELGHTVALPSIEPDTYNVTWPVKTDVTDHHHNEGQESLVLIISIITVVLAVAAIVISSVVCRRYRLHVKLKPTTDLELRRYTEGASPSPGVEQHQGNIYSDLRPGNGGSIHNYTGLSHYLRQYDTVIQNEAGASNCTLENTGQYRAVPGSTGQYNEIGEANQVDAMNSVYDEVNYSDSGYLQIKDIDL